MALPRHRHIPLSRLGAPACALLLLLSESQVWLGWNDGGVGTVPSGDRLVRGLLLVASVAPLAWRRRWPLGVVATICAAMVLQLLAVTPFLPFLGALLPMAVANYTAAAYAVRWRATSLVLTFSTQAVIYAVIPEERVQGEVLFSAFVILGTWLAGDVVRARSIRADLSVRAANSLVARQAAEAATALADERASIARELHDVIAHSVSVMGIQAGAARTLIDSEDLVAARASVLAIEETARSSVDELQRLLRVLRTEGAAPAGREPSPGLGMLDRLVDQVRSAGMTVTVSVQRLPVLPAGVDQVAYRIIQESLTNVLKHGSSPATVTVAHRGRTLHLEIDDLGPHPATGPDGSARELPPEQPEHVGHGLIGMRERVQLYGGTLHTDRAPSGGFRVRATLPLERQAHPEPAR